ncbi:pleckstrin homology domain-containing family A member 7 [Gastrophryne carolinensis]
MATATESLPELWSYGVCRDGRVFFIDDRNLSTTWLHPRTGEPVNSGHMIRSDLPRGWEEGFTSEGASYFINHNQRATTFTHPVTGEISPENADFDLREEGPSVISPQQLRPHSMVSEGSTSVTAPTAEARPVPKVLKASGRTYSFGKRDQSIKRNPSVPVLVRGWLYKQDSSGMKLWKRRWFLLSDYCLFYYKDSREEAILGSIPLPGYSISPTQPDDRISRKYSFKAVHAGMRAYIPHRDHEHAAMRTYYFSADTQEDMNGWIRAMSQAALIQALPDNKREEDADWPPTPLNNHIDSDKEHGQQEALLIRSSCSGPWEPVMPKSAEPQRHSGEKELHRSGNQGGYPAVGEKEHHREAEERERYRKAREKEHYRNISEQNQTREPVDRYGDPGLPERYQDYRDRESFIAHNNAQNAFLSANRCSVFNNFAGPHRHSPAALHMSQAEAPAFERNGTLPSSFRVNAGPVLHNGTGSYRRVFVPRANPEQPSQRRSTMGQVEQWVKVQKVDNRSMVPEPERYQTLPKSTRLPSSSPPPDYKYAQDRVSHLKMSNQERQATKEGMVWQLYEWQQRQQYKHGSPTWHLHKDTLDMADRTRAKSLLDVPRCVSVPPSPSDVPLDPPPARAFPPRRPHTPAGRLTVRPEEEAVAVPYICSPQKPRLGAVKTATHADRRSVPSMGYMTHTVSAPSLHGQSADDTYVQLKKELEYLDLKIKYNDPLINLVHSVLQNSAAGYRASLNVTGRESVKDRSGRPVRIAESDVDVKLSILCEQDRILQDLEDKIRALKDNKDKLETVLEVLHRQMDQYKEQPQHTEKISYQQRLLQEDLVQIRAELSRVSTDMEASWNEYLRLESDVVRLRQMLQEQMSSSPFAQERAQLQKELWRIEDVTAGLSSNKLNYKVLVESFKNPERKTVPLVTSAFVPSGSTAFTSVRSKSSFPQDPPPLVKPTLEVGLYPQPYDQRRSQSQPHQLLQRSETRAVTSPRPEESIPPRPPLPDMYSPDDPYPLPNIPPPPALPPPPRESSIIRHTSVRGLKRQADERKRDRESGQNGDYRVELRTYVSDPELVNLGSDPASPPSGYLALDSGYQSLPTRGSSGAAPRLPQSSSVASYITLRRGTTHTEASKERPRSAFERLYAGDNQSGKMSAEEQLERMKRHQKALVRERKRTLSQGDKQPVPSAGRPASRPLSADVSSWRREQEFDLQLLEKAARGVEDFDLDDQDWVQARAVQITEVDLEPQEYDLDISKELATPDKVAIPERYIEMEPEEPLSHEELEARHRKVEKIKHILARSSVHNLVPPVHPDELLPSDMDAQMQQQERRITISYALASEASLRSKQVAAHAIVDH